MTSKDDAAKLFKAIRRIVRAIDLRSREVARAVGLTIPQIVVLQAARDLGKVTTKALSQHADLSAPTVVIILDKLEERGLVVRHRSPIDRRIVHTRLTPEGRGCCAPRRRCCMTNSASNLRHCRRRSRPRSSRRWTRSPA
ncbi:MarR family transcriptional regulator [Breoghania sp. L-A4]|uniref:MarR family winged helix-turn-helix transcriptional regulator n=1 Tax=Breoghania sp. L-A4 TaxID=2304600 RepID=UPI003204D16F